MKYFQIIGLIVDIIGAGFLYFGSEVISKVMSDVLQRINFRSESNQGSVPRFYEEIFNANDLSVAHKKSHRLTIAGLILVGLGFLLQLLGSI